jgi:DNA topoisomerase VI subunit B
MAKIKTGGRQRGTPNKVTSDIRTVLHSLVSDELDHLSTRLHKMDDEQRTQTFLKLLPYIMPKMQAITHTDERPIKPLVMRILQVGEDIDTDIEDENDFVVQVVNKPHQDQKSD